MSDLKTHLAEPNWKVEIFGSGTRLEQFFARDALDDIEEYVRDNYDEGVTRIVVTASPCAARPRGEWCLERNVGSHLENKRLDFPSDVAAAGSVVAQEIAAGLSGATQGVSVSRESNFALTNSGALIYATLYNSLAKGMMVPFLGSGVSSWSEKPKPAWQPIQRPGVEMAYDYPSFPPNVPELSQYLATLCNFPAASSEERNDLSRVASYYICQNTPFPLSQVLGDIFRNVTDTNGVHGVLARIAKERPMLIVTTNYDCLMERALRAAKVNYDVIIQQMPDEGTGSCVHLLLNQFPDERSNERHQAIWKKLLEAPLDDLHRLGITDAKKAWEEQKRSLPGNPGPLSSRAAPTSLPNFPSDQLHRVEISPLKRTTIYKMHGSIFHGKEAAENMSPENFVISEEDYLNFLSNMNGAPPLVPNMVKDHIRPRSFCFLGYSLRDWNLRMLLQSLRPVLPVKTEDKKSNATIKNDWQTDYSPVNQNEPERLAGNFPEHWAIQFRPALAEVAIWQSRKVNIYNVDFETFVRRLKGVNSSLFNTPL